MNTRGKKDFTCLYISFIPHGGAGWVAVGGGGA